ncbi:MAG: hypothetical protein Q7V05_01570 [Methanoregula sp.]|nr:hypothetical protein [Methanoregula sp.]MDP2796838.1 hypothetical protein [Methanoregula sp.]
MMNPESEVRDIKQNVMNLSLKIDVLLHEREMTTMMKLSEASLKSFFDEEPDLYSIKDARVVYR